MNQQPDDLVNKAGLIAELSKLGIKHTPEQIVKIAKQSDGKIVFLEEGNRDSGLQHILENHSDDFFDIGIEIEQIADAVITALKEGKMVGYQGRKKTRSIYEVNFNGEVKYIVITVSDNGYIVGANPRTSS